MASQPFLAILGARRDGGADRRLLVGSRGLCDLRGAPPRPDRRRLAALHAADPDRSEEHTSELQSLMRISYAVFCLKQKNINHTQIATIHRETHIHQTTQ